MLPSASSVSGEPVTARSKANSSALEVDVVGRERDGADAELLERVDEVAGLGPAGCGQRLEHLDGALVVRLPEDAPHERDLLLARDADVREDGGELRR